MCGIAGIMDLSTAGGDALAAPLARMTGTIAHRGPDGEGFWVNDGVALGHRRLAIIDLTDTGHQPMVSADGRWVLSYNGEIYNFRAIRQELEACGVRFRGASDTEVLLEACALLGVEAAVQRMAGMFAFALWDRQERRLHLVRDRLGIKPLYYAQLGGRTYWASELSAIETVAGDGLVVEPAAVAGLLRFGYIPAPLSIYREARKLAPGIILTIDAAGTRQTAYWTLAAAVQSGRRGTITDAAEAVEKLDSLLREVVSQHLISDVPLGSFLSGGIDSSLVTAIAQAQSGRALKSFSIGFEEKSFDEAPFARAIATHLGTDHTELYVSEVKALDIVGKIGAIFDEPFADSSQIPTYLVSQLARQHVTVALSGDGGDETFTGYDRYFRNMAVRDQVDKICRTAGRMLPLAYPMSAMALGLGFRRQGLRLHRLHRYARQGDGAQNYREMMHQSYGIAGVLVDRHDDLLQTAWPDTHVTFASQPLSHEVMQYVDTLTYLPDDILTKVDRASMAVSLETRVPLLDHRIVEMGWSLAPQIKHDNKDRGKIVLRDVLARYVPPEMFERPKMGFGIPLMRWLTGPLRDWSEAMLETDNLATFGIEKKQFLPCWEALQSGDESYLNFCWSVIALAAWRTARPQRLRAGRVAA